MENFVADICLNRLKFFIMIVLGCPDRRANVFKFNFGILILCWWFPWQTFGIFLLLIPFRTANNK
jgi:hypothetical protein